MRLALILLLSSSLLPAPAAADPAHVDITAVDGLVLGASYYAATGPGPGILLLHQCNRDRSSWIELATLLADAGNHVLTMDFRGFGQSINADIRSFHSQAEELWPAFDDDVERALALLKSMPDVDGERIGVMGASCGGSQSLLLALRHPEVRAVGFLSSSLPRIDAMEVDAFEVNRSVAVLAIAADEDQASADVARRAFEHSGHDASRLILYKGDRHGVPLFEQDMNLPDAIVDWFGTALGAL